MQAEQTIAVPRRRKHPVMLTPAAFTVLAAILALVTGCATALPGAGVTDPSTSEATSSTDPLTTDGEQILTDPADVSTTTESETDSDSGADPTTDATADVTTDPTTDAAAMKTEQVLIDPFDSDGALKSEYQIDDQNPVDIFDCGPSLSAVSDNVLECAPYAAHTNVCWPGDSAYELLCSHAATSYSLFLAVSETPLPAASAVSEPLPWQLELADGSTCAVRYGGAWEDGPADTIGYYSCDGPSEFVLAPSLSLPIDMTDDLWTVQTGQLGTDASVPAPTTQSVAVAYFAAFAAGKS